MTKPKGYDEAFIEFWYEDVQKGLASLPFLQARQKNTALGAGGPLKMFWLCPFVESTEFCLVDAWEVYEAMIGGIMVPSREALWEWAKANPADDEAVWPAVLGFSADAYPQLSKPRQLDEAISAAERPLPF